MNKAPKPKSEITEARLQAECVKWFKNTYREYAKKYYMNNNNSVGGKRGALAKAMGLTPGIPDTFLAMPRNGKHGLYIEFKLPGEKLTPDQEKVFPELLAEGYAIEVCFNEAQFHFDIRNYLESDDLPF